VKYAWIKDNKQLFNIGMMCDVLNVGRSSYYDWIKSTPSLRELENQYLSEKVKSIFMESRSTYGTRRIRSIMVRGGNQISRRRVGKLMKRSNIYCKTKRKFKNTTDSNHRFAVTENILDRDFTASQPNQKYVGDITYIFTLEGWLYLSTVIDLFSRKVVGWSISNRITASLVNDALLMAIWSRKPDRGLIWHTDRGSQYASDSHREIIQDHGIIQSMRCSLKNQALFY